MNKIICCYGSCEKVKTELDQKTQPQPSISTYVTMLKNVKIEQWKTSEFKGTVKKE